MACDSRVEVLVGVHRLGDAVAQEVEYLRRGKQVDVRKVREADFRAEAIAALVEPVADLSTAQIQQGRVPTAIEIDEADPVGV